MRRTVLIALVLVLGSWLVAVAQDVSPRVSAVTRRQPPDSRPKKLVDNATPVRSCESLGALRLPATTIDEVRVDEGTATLPRSCRVTATVSHAVTADRIKVFVALSMADWNGRFQGTGGEGYSGGSADVLSGRSSPLLHGYATAATDTGHDTWGASFVLDDAGRLNWHAIQDNAYRGIHEMTVTAKLVVEAFYGKPPVRSYFEGCSAGGRQAMMEAQRYPLDYDGILAGAPGINVPQVSLAHVWRLVVMEEIGHDVSVCKFAAASQAAVASCDAIDGVQDGVLENPLLCGFDPRTLAGTVVNNCGTFSANDVEVIARVWHGPRRRDGAFLWYGPPPGADYGAIREFDESTRVVEGPGRLDREWFRFFLTQDPAWEFGKMSRAQYEEYWDQSVQQFGAVMTAMNPDLTTFRDRGEKLIMWHGWSDHSTPAQGSIAYYEQLQGRMGGPSERAGSPGYSSAPAPVTAAEEAGRPKFDSVRSFGGSRTAIRRTF